MKEEKTESGTETDEEMTDAGEIRAKREERTNVMRRLFDQRRDTPRLCEWILSGDLRWSLSKHSVRGRPKERLGS
ncbi:unnamed protein product [Boreogadus saida]